MHVFTPPRTMNTKAAGLCRMRLYRDRTPADLADAAAGDFVCPKLQAVRRWAMQRLEKLGHEQRVADIATSLFDLLRPLHRLTLTDRRLLVLGALVHDIGRCVCKAEHPAEGAWMLLDDATLPITPAERRGLAYLTLYHRGPVPQPGSDAILQRGDDHDRLLRVLALFRSADALDSRSLDEPARLVFAMAPSARSSSNRIVRATCYVGDDVAKARKVYRRRKKFRLLEELLGVRVMVEIEPADAVRLVA
jgi:exopolyphosphatase/pppGpp-phosphohydrolase